MVSLGLGLWVGLGIGLGLGLYWVVHYFHEYYVSRKVICEWEF